MKKLKFGALVFAVLALTACNAQFGLVYNVSITGNGDGDFKVVNFINL